MGYIPIILTMGGAILLFFMVVHQSLLSKKSTILRLETEVLAGLKNFGGEISATEALTHDVLDRIDAGFQLLKSQPSGVDSGRFEQQVKIPYRDMKVTISQYNQLVSKKPYSYVARLMRHSKIGG